MRQILQCGNPSQFFTKNLIVEKFFVQHIMLIGFDFDMNKFDCELFDLFGIYCPDNIRKSVYKRQAEFFAGRYAAKVALNKLGIENYYIPIGHNRAPVWPNGVIASLTHNADSAICAIANELDVNYLGVDLENIMSEQFALELKSFIINDIECTYLESLDLPFRVALSLVFSAKESLFKALYPYVGYYFDFNAALITRLCIDKNEFEFELSDDLSEEFRKGTKVHGRFLFEKDSVLTCVYHLKHETRLTEHHRS